MKNMIQINEMELKYQTIAMIAEDLGYEIKIDSEEDYTDRIEEFLNKVRV